ncbi:helix-turn-helix domain-containing protein [Myroides sp. N17-2]|uniref:AraC family transcriptional regulator n=1 Tax=Myroides sp. N17-2 TaxID=2030799 RepID=UPI0013045312|nr:helix-turn-helix domain-containing protein [Myroides sp. N17-2]
MLLKKKVPTFSNSFELLTLLTTIIFILDFIVFYFDLNIDVLLLFLPLMVTIINFNDSGKESVKLFDTVGFIVLMIAIFCDYITPVKMNVIFAIGMFALTISFYLAYIKRQGQVNNIIIRNYFHIFFVVLSSISFLKFLYAIKVHTFLNQPSIIEFFLFSVLVFYVALTGIHLLMLQAGKKNDNRERVFTTSNLTIENVSKKVEQVDRIIHVEEEIVQIDNAVVSTTTKVGREIISFLENEDAYLDADFSLQDLATALDINRIELSEVINRELNSNFYSLVAQYRIQNAKQLLRDKQNLLIEGVMQEVGFNSKITFNKYFKNFVGMTPSEFRRQNIVNEVVLG